MKGAVTSTCNEVLGPRNPNHKKKKIEERKVKKVNRSVERSLKADKRNHLESLAAEAEEAAYHGNMRDLYATIRNLSGKYSKPEETGERKGWERQKAEENMGGTFSGAAQPTCSSRPSGHTASRE